MGQFSSFLLEHVAALEGALALQVGRRVGLRHVLAGQDEGHGAVGLGNRVRVRCRGFVVVSRAHHVHVREHAEAGHGFHRLVSRAVLAHANRVVGQDVRHRELGEGRNAEGRAHVVGEHQEGGARRGKHAAVSNAVGNAAHGVLADAVVKVLAGVGLAEAAAEVARTLDVVLVGAVQVAAAAHVSGEHVSDLVDDAGARSPGGFWRLRARRDGLEDFRDRRALLGQAVFEHCLEVWVSSAPSFVSLGPLVVALGELGLAVREEAVGVGAHVPLLVGEAQVLAGRVYELHASFAVGRVGARHFVDALADDGLANDGGRLAVVVRLAFFHGGVDGLEVVPVGEGDHVPAERGEAHGVVFGLGELGHLVEGHVVGVEEQDQVVELFVGREGHGFVGDPLLEAAVAAEHEHVVVHDGVVRRVEARRRHLLRHRQAHRVGNAGAERASGGLNARGGVLRVRELWVAGGGRVPLAEVGHLVHGDVVAADVQPRVKEHRAVARGKHEAIAVQPGRFLRVVGHRLAPEHGTDFGGAQREAQVARLGSGDGVHGQAAGLVGRLCKNQYQYQKQRI